MKRSTARWTTSLAAAALLGLPTVGLAQTQPPATSTQQPTSTTSPQAAPAQNADAQDHLRQAKAALDSIAPTAVTGRNKTQLAELKRHLNALERAAGSNSNASATGTTAKSARSTAAKGTANWSSEVAAADKILTSMIGPAGTTGTPADPTATTGTSGSAKGATSPALDEATRTQLTEVRTHLTAFAAAMSGTSTPREATPDTAAASTSAAGSTAAAAGSGATGTASTTGSAAQDPAQPPAAAQSQVDQEAARRHLTEARDTLSQLTQLPAAAQLSGEARTQVSQLISNFNELITTQSEWRTAYAKLDANLTALVGPDATDAEATGGVSTGTAGTTGTAGATGTSGTAGTTGTTAGVANLDPAIRAKLVELRAKLNQFEKAAGGVAAAAAATDSTTGSMGSTTGSTTSSTSGSTTGATTTTGSSAGSMTGSQSTTPSTPQSTSAATEQMGHQEAMRHIAAIEAILNANSPASSTAGTSGSTTGTTAGTTGSTTPATGAGLTLTSAQLEQLRTHLTELRRLVGDAKK